MPDRRAHTVFARAKVTFAMQGIAYFFVVIAGVFWLVSPSTIAVDQLGPWLTPISGVIALTGSLSALYGHIRGHWLPEEIGAYLVALSAGAYAYSIAIDSMSDATKGMGFCIIAAFFTLCVMRIFQIEHSTAPSDVAPRMAGSKV